jgi:hypothetical protein
MTDVLLQIAQMIPSTALPVVIVVLGCFYIYKKIGNEREKTKKSRDAEYEELKTRITIIERELEEIKQLDLSAKLAQILTELAWIKERLKEKER